LFTIASSSSSSINERVKLIIAPSTIPINL
jgi:hypothetical protein